MYALREPVRAVEGGLVSSAAPQCATKANAKPAWRFESIGDQLRSHNEFTNSILRAQYPTSSAQPLHELTECFIICLIFPPPYTVASLVYLLWGGSQDTRGYVVDPRDT